MDWQQVIALLIVALAVAGFVFATIRNRRNRALQGGCAGCAHAAANLDWSTQPKSKNRKKVAPI